MKYRPEIDGLRTIAVLSVIIYHAEYADGSSHHMKGGFLGVDVFFVISGFLITSLIMDEYRNTGRFSILSFYERRARRLLPALLVVILASFPFAWLYLLPNQFIDYSNSIIASIFFGSNFYWHVSLQEYGAESALLRPFLHTWSLAVEEQYYILFPLFLIGIYRWLKHHILIVLIVGLLISLEFADLATHVDASFSFYMLPSRFWELLAGGILANYLYLHPRKNNNPLLSLTMPSLGLGLIIYAVSSIGLGSNHPGFVTLTPVIGTILIILFANPKDLVTRVLSSRIFVGAGLISYSLYLWHYPVYAFARLTTKSLSSNDKLALLLLTILLSAITYFLIEKPFRNRKAIARRTLVITLGFSSTMALIANVAVVYKDGVPARMPPIVANVQTNILNARICETPGASCTFNVAQHNRIFLIGDSHMMALEKPLLKYAIQNNSRLTTLNSTGCQYMLNLNRINKETHEPYRSCTTDLQAERREILLSSKPSTVIVGGRLPLILSEKRFDNTEGGNEGEMLDYFQYPDHSLETPDDRKAAISKEYRNSLLELAQHGHTIVLIYPVPEVGWHVPNEIKNLFNENPYSIGTLLAEKPITTSYEVYLERTRESFALLDGIRHENIIRIYPHKLFCDTTIENRCITHNLENCFYRDDDHLSDAGSELLLTVIAKKLNP